jgi:hypothetical protein
MHYAVKIMLAMEEKKVRSGIMNRLKQGASSIYTKLLVKEQSYLYKITNFYSGGAFYCLAYTGFITLEFAIHDLLMEYVDNLSQK